MIPVKKIILLNGILLGLLLLVLSGTSTAVAGENIPKNAKAVAQCLTCHQKTSPGKTPEAAKSPLTPKERQGPPVDGAEFLSSVHGKYSCTACHSGITSTPPQAVDKKIRRAQLNRRCQTCHRELVSAIAVSAHGDRLKAQDQNVYCFDCHGNHTILKKTNPRSTVFPLKVAETCGRCHQKYYRSYRSSFHGAANLLGSRKAASCVSCHGSHEILSRAEPASPVYKDNLPRTCARCHPGVTPNIAKGVEHFEPLPNSPGAPMYYVEKVFQWLLTLTVSALLVHILLELLRKFISLSRSK